MFTDNQTINANDGVDIELGMMNQAEEQENAIVDTNTSVPMPRFYVASSIGKLIFSKENCVPVSSAIGLSFANTGLYLLAPYLLGEIVNLYTTNSNTVTILGQEYDFDGLIKLFVAASFLAQGIPHIVSLLLAQPTVNNTKKIVMDCMEHQFKKSLNFYVKEPTSKHTQLVQQAIIIGAMGLPTLMQLTPTLMQLILADVYFFGYGSEMGGSILALVAMNFVFTLITALPVGYASGKSLDTWNKMQESVTEKIKSYKTMRDFCKTEYTLNQFESIVSKWAPWYYKSLAIQAPANIGQLLITYAHMLWVAQYIGSRVQSGQYTIQDFVTAISYLQVLSAVLPAFGQSVLSTIVLYPYAKYVFETLYQPDEVVDLHPTNLFPVIGATAPSIEFNQVTYYLPKRSSKHEIKLAFENLSFQVMGGGRVAIVTESGVGKTTLFNLIFGYDKPTKGKVCINGIDITQMSLQALQKNITIFEQNPLLFKGSIRDNIAYGAENPEHVTDEMIWEMARSANLDEFLHHFEQKLEACDLIKLTKNPMMLGKEGVKALLTGVFGVIYAQKKLFTVELIKDNEQLIEKIKPLNRKQDKYELLISYFENIGDNQSRAATREELPIITSVTNREALDADVGESGKALSGGEKQKVALLRCLFKQTRIWLLDEVTASLDATTANEILSTLSERANGVTCLMTNHKLHEVRQFAETIIVLNKKGQVAGLGTHDTLLRTCPLYADLWAKCNKQEGRLDARVSVTSNSIFSSSVSNLTLSNGIVNSDGGASMRLTRGAHDNEE